MTELVIEHLGARGDGVAHGEQGPIYVPFTAPGDRIAQIDGAWKVMQAGNRRQNPRCRHFTQCGGCVLQHVDDSSYRQWLGKRIQMALSQHGLTADIRAPQVSPPQSRRRAALQARWQRGDIAVGFAMRASHDLIDMQECPVLEPALFALVTPLRELLRQFLPKKATARAELLLCDNGVDILLHGLDGDDPLLFTALVRLGEAHDVARLSLGEQGRAWQLIAQRRNPQISLGGAILHPPPGAFLQATKAGEHALQSAVMEAVGQARTIADLFAGLGTFSLLLAAQAKVTAVEGDREALAALSAAVNRRQGGKPITCEHRDLFRRPLSLQELAQFDAVVFDPPRPGAKAQAEILAQSKVDKIVAVSCNPNSFARDARLLVDGGYLLDWILPVGQFLWSAEVELVACFSHRERRHVHRPG